MKSQRRICGNLAETQSPYQHLAIGRQIRQREIPWNGNFASMAHSRCQAGLCASARVSMARMYLNVVQWHAVSDMRWCFEDVWSLNICHCHCQWFEYVGTEVSRSSGKEMDVVVKHISTSKKTAARFAAGFFGELFPATSSVSLCEGHWCCGLCGLPPLHAVIYIYILEHCYSASACARYLLSSPVMAPGPQKGPWTESVRLQRQSKAKMPLKTIIYIYIHVWPYLITHT